MNADPLRPDEPLKLAAELEQLATLQLLPRPAALVMRAVRLLRETESRREAATALAAAECYRRERSYFFPINRNPTPSIK